MTASFPPFEVDFSAPRVTRKKVKGPLLLPSWPDLVPFVFIRPESKEKERFFYAMGGPPVDSSNSMNEGGSMRKADFLSI